jgi:hypothetical protein
MWRHIPWYDNVHVSETAGCRLPVSCSVWRLWQSCSCCGVGVAWLHRRFGRTWVFFFKGQEGRSLNKCSAPWPRMPQLSCLVLPSAGTRQRNISCHCRFSNRLSQSVTLSHWLSLLFLSLSVTFCHCNCCFCRVLSLSVPVPLCHCLSYSVTAVSVTVTVIQKLLLSVTVTTWQCLMLSVTVATWQCLTCC